MGSTGSSPRSYAHVPPYMRDAAVRLDSMGYTVEYFNRPGPCRCHPKQHVIDAISANSTRVRIVIKVGIDGGTGQMELLGSLIIDGTQVKLFDLETPERFWRFVELDGLCWCGKKPMYEEGARDSLDKALLRRVLMNQSRRREVRYYPCDLWQGVYHLTSQGKSEPITAEA